ncbi:MAG TPA: Rho termination factor N-terminal domain-containing protein [Holophaga sp.]|nr:Rho termination factor N-terminal domain-containing protein [Holophaga sp.]
MKTYEVVAPYAGVNSGTVQITPEQARARRFALEPLGDDLYRVTQPTGFKRGEMFAFDGDMPKDLALCLEALEPEPEIEPETEEAGETEEAIETLDIDLEDMDREELLAMAKELGLKPHPNTGKPRLLEVIKEQQDVMLAEQEAAREEA